MQQRKSRWRYGVMLVLALLSVVTPLFMAAGGQSKVFADNPPAGTSCPDGYSYSTSGNGGQQGQTWVANACNGDAPQSNICPVEGGAQYQYHQSSSYLVSSFPTATYSSNPDTCSGPPVKSAQATAAPTSQADCNAQAAGQIFKNGQCIPPTAQADCDNAIPGSNFQPGANQQLAECTGGSVGTQSNTTDTSNTEPTTSCDLAFNGDLASLSIKILVCPIIDGLTALMGKFDDFLNSQLQYDVAGTFDPAGPYHVAWNSFRVIAIGLVVVAALIMVVSQAMGLELLDAYTIRKVLPALLAAAITIGLSWDILRVLFDLSNAASSGVRELIYYPFSHIGNIQITGGSALSLALIGTGAALALGWGGLLAFAATGALAVATGLFGLLLVHTLASGLAIAAPLGIACAILPNTRKGYDIWKDGLLAVLVAPIVMSAVIALFRVGAVISYNAPGNTLIHGLVAIFLYFGADFAAFWALSRVQGLVSTLTGMVNDRSRGAFDRLKNYRGKKVNENMSAMKSGSRFADTNPLGKTFNTASRGIGNANKMGFNPAKWNSRLNTANDQATRTAAANVMNSAEYKNVKEDGNALRAMSVGNATDAHAAVVDHAMQNMHMTREEAEKEATRAVSAVQTSVGFGRSQQLAGFQGMVDTGTAITDERDQQILGARAAGKNKNTLASMAGYANFKNKQVGRHDLAPGFGSLYEAFQREAGVLPGGSTGPMTTGERHVQIHGGWESTTDASGNVTQKYIEGLMEKASRSADPIATARDRAPGYTKLVDHWKQEYAGAVQDFATEISKGASASAEVVKVNADRIRKSEAWFHEQVQSRPYASGENVKILTTVLESPELKGAQAYAGANRATPASRTLLDEGQAQSRMGGRGGTL